MLLQIGSDRAGKCLDDSPNFAPAGRASGLVGEFQPASGF